MKYVVAIAAVNIKEKKIKRKKYVVASQSSQINSPVEIVLN